MGAVWGFVVGAWNFVVSVAPTVAHTICQLTEGASKTLTLP